MASSISKIAVRGRKWREVSIMMPRWENRGASCTMAACTKAPPSPRYASWENASRPRSAPYTVCATSVAVGDATLSVSGHPKNGGARDRGSNALRGLRCAAAAEWRGGVAQLSSVPRPSVSFPVLTATDKAPTGPATAPRGVRGTHREVGGRGIPRTAVDSSGVDPRRHERWLGEDRLVPVECGAEGLA